MQKIPYNRSHSRLLDMEFLDDGAGGAHSTWDHHQPGRPWTPSRCGLLINDQVGPVVPELLSTKTEFPSLITLLRFEVHGWWPKWGPIYMGPAPSLSPMGPLQDPWTRFLIKCAKWSHNYKRPKLVLSLLELGNPFLTGFSLAHSPLSIL